MPSVHVLSPDVRGKIAAGEVITRPSSVVKELLENSLDARARRIEIDIGNGGKLKCLVNDDGQGMSREDAQLALERYATSKITSIDDILHIQTFGFRGEALASIAHVSQFELETSNGTVGTRIVAEAGKIKGVYDSARPRGTRIKVTNLFFNLPVRAKFLKSGAWERRLIIELVKTYAIVCPDVAFAVAASGKQVLSLQPVSSMEQRAKMLLPRPVVDLLTTVNFRLGQARVEGVLSRPGLSVKHKMTHIYVNSRPVRYPRLLRTIMEVYENPQTMPAFALNIQVLPELVDVNIHPTKSEVKFKDERYIMDLLSQVIKREIFKKPVSYEYDTVQHVTVNAETIPARFVQDRVMSYDDKERVESASGGEGFWQLHNTYILAQTKSGLIIVDQHVAHERVIYESIMKERVQSQRLLFPITLELTPEEHEVYEKTKHTLQEMGIEFKEFSAHTVVIDSLPSGVRTNREEIAGLFTELSELGDLVKQKSKIATVIACRGAIKAGQRLSPGEMQALIDHLFATDNPYTCPHGRPIVIRLTNEELARKFGRSLPVAH